ncbi:uncharacterized protein BDR25DRAFT_256563 [Lindgomyces ingoldianus]|uniref:Uncharacterized protein n=1 Tax=Lindgomyces ingoldianus TaxID=673940 RepID=A0ACB6R3L0_9PLEO|nr:uncharacterized protein BDR25DRAFT_256563 [Lindgomyces ingoldianus]KAF2473726.1 hypothetical protein BDR25DRAFT_256563 [Lindgomyces ingoldianus]
MAQNPKSSILVPLYIYPDHGKWDPLYEAIVANQDVNFTIIINPNSGPGSAPWWPNDDYVREIPRLNEHSNVRIVGYVRTAYCQRPIQEVYRDITKYAEWSRDHVASRLSVKGIFFDETTNVFSEEVREYLDAISQYVKQSEGILGDRTVIHNPGTAVDARLANPGPDVTAVVEVAHSTYQTPEYQQWLSTSSYDRSRTCYIIHSVQAEDVKRLAYGLRERAAYLFVTDLSENYYQSFGSSWKHFVEAIKMD